MNKIITILFLSLIILTNVSAFGDTYIPGATITTDVIWDMDNSPYIVTGKVYIQSGASLTIEPGIYIDFSNSTNLLGMFVVRGTLTANGVTFDGDQVGSVDTWAVVEVQSGGTLNIKNCDLFGRWIPPSTGGKDWRGIHITGNNANDINIESCTFSGFSNAITSGSNNFLDIKNCNFGDCGRGIGIQYGIANITGCSFGYLSYDGVTVSGGPRFVGASASISYCIFSDSPEASGILGLNDANATIEFCCFSNLKYAVNNGSSNQFIAEYCWWNSDAGPTNSNNPDGTGEAIVGNVDYDPWMRGDCGSKSSISGIVSSDSSGLLGVSIDLYNSVGSIIASSTSNDTGFYQFDELENGYYTVSIATPLGYLADYETKEVDIIGGEYRVDFELSQLDIPFTQRGRGYWMHQVNALLSDKGHPQESYDDMCSYMALIRTHFNEHGLNPINVFQVPLTDDCGQKLEALQETISPKAKATMIAKARAHLTALLLNMVSGKIAQWAIISEDDAALSQAITFCNILITDEIADNDEIAKDIAELINENQMVPSGWIDFTTPAYVYKYEDDMSLPTTFALHQNYPNPFNPETQISFALPERTDVKLDVYNIMGQKVTTVAEGSYDAGIHTVTWDGSQSASGVYFYKLTAGDFEKTRKMLLLK